MTLNSITKSLQKLSKSRTYLKPGEQPPKGVNVQRGRKGGIFYDSTPTSASEKKMPDKKENNSNEQRHDDAKVINTQTHGGGPWGAYIDKKLFSVQAINKNGTARHLYFDKVPTDDAVKRLFQEHDFDATKYHIWRNNGESEPIISRRISRGQWADVNKSLKHSFIYRLYKATSGSKSFGEAANRMRPPRQPKGSASFGAAASKNIPYTTEYKSMDDVVKSLQELSKAGPMYGGGYHTRHLHDNPKVPQAGGSSGGDTINYEAVAERYKTQPLFNDKRQPTVTKMGAPLTRRNVKKGGMGSGRKAGAVHNVSPKSPRGTIAARKNPGQAGII
jgi:hypothetical protein